MPDAPDGNVGPFTGLERAAIRIEPQRVCRIAGDTGKAFLGCQAKQGASEVHDDT